MILDHYCCVREHAPWDDDHMDKWQQTRKRILERDNGICVRCGREAVDVHHRLRKGMGGTKKENINYGAGNLVSLCRDCHAYVHAHPRESYRTGFLVASWDSPEGTQIVTKFGTIMLHPDFTVEQTEGPCEIF